jgi:hypothetical protein
MDRRYRWCDTRCWAGFAERTHTPEKVVEAMVDEAVEQRDAADEAGASDGASPLISVFGVLERVREALR